VLMDEGRVVVRQRVAGQLGQGLFLRHGY
jgi:hypothetical protein